MSEHSEYCVRHGHDWAHKTGSAGKVAKVCMRCGTDELSEAIRILRYFQKICRDMKPVGQWPGEHICVALDVVLNNFEATP